ncbi:MAG: polysaccharide deacetylase family protein [Planctomycetes bacterium]|nr:polysaccharide deacetylase family protein [Planctomycetota bacterium]
MAEPGISTRPWASLSLDLDNLWSYLRVHGDAGWESFPSYLDVAVPRILGFLAERNLTVTVFVVGQDAALEENRAPLGALAAAGHEIGNHSFSHEPWLHLLEESAIEDEIVRAEEAIEAATGQRPRGFRGPGFSLSLAALRVLERRGYLYDSSTLPTFAGPLARLYYLMRSDLKGEERQKRARLFGGFSEGFRPLRPYRWRLEGSGVVEVPVTTLPLLRLPMHASYVLYLSTFSPALARAYFALAARLCRTLGVRPCLLLHPLDFLGGDDVSRLDFFPAMRLPGAVKLERLGRLLETYTRCFDVRPLGEWVRRTLEEGPLAEVEPRFAQ